MSFGAAGSKRANGAITNTSSDIQITPPDPLEAAAATQSVDSPESFLEVVQSNDSQKTQALFDAIASKPIDEFIDEVLAIATNEPFVFGNYYFQNAQDYLFRYETELQALAGEHTTVGDYLNSVGIHSASDIDISQLESALSTAETLMEAGGVEAMLDGRSNFEDTSAFDGLSLQEGMPPQPMAGGGGGGQQGAAGAAVNCAVAGAGTVAGAVATGVGCFIIGPLCLVGGFFTLAAGVETVQACGEAAAAMGGQGGGQPGPAGPPPGQAPAG